MKKLMIFPALLFALQGIAQRDDASKFASEIKTSFLQQHLTIIAGEEMQGRETGTEGQRRAAAYIEDQFKKMGLKTPANQKGYQQFYPLYKDSLVKSELQIGKTEAVYGTHYIAALLNNENGDFKSDDIVFAGYGIEDKNYNDYEGLDVKNKVLLIFLGEPKMDGNYVVSGSAKPSEWTFPGLSKKLNLASEKGAAGVFLISPAQVSFSERSVNGSKKTNLFYPRTNANKKLNYVMLSHDFAKSVFPNEMDSLIAYAKTSRPFNAGQRFSREMKAKYDFKKEHQRTDASNVIGVIEGTDKKDEYVFITAHYDHLGMHDGKIYYGADDDGSGTVAVMQMASAFLKAKAAGKGPRRTIVFMAVSGEEKGLLGSEYYSDNPLYPLEKTSIDLNIDMVGRVDTERTLPDTLNYVYVVGHDKISTELPIVNEGMNKKYTNLTLDYKFDDPNDKNRIYFRSDHYNFAKKGVPVLFFYDGMLQSDYHKPTDTVDKINWPLYEKRVKMIFHTAWEVANRDEMLKRDLPIPTATR